jgi:hypothetical protein
MLITDVLAEEINVTKMLQIAIFLQLSKKRDIYASLSSRKVCHF